MQGEFVEEGLRCDRAALRAGRRVKALTDVHGFVQRCEKI